MRTLASPGRDNNWRYSEPCGCRRVTTRARLLLTGLFQLNERELRAQFERARKYVPNFKEFVVFVTDLGLVLEEADW